MTCLFEIIANCLRDFDSCFQQKVWGWRNCLAIIARWITRTNFDPDCGKNCLLEGFDLVRKETLCVKS